MRMNIKVFFRIQYLPYASHMCVENVPLFVLQLIEFHVAKASYEYKNKKECKVKRYLYYF